MSTNNGHIKVTVTSTDGIFVDGFHHEIAARRFISEELEWESTIRVQCEFLKIDERGSFV